MKERGGGGEINTWPWLWQLGENSKAEDSFHDRGRLIFQ